MKNIFLIIASIFVLGSAKAAIPVDNQYRVDVRHYSEEAPQYQFTVSPEDETILVKPSIFAYTDLNTLNPDAVYTIRPYKNTEFLPPMGKWVNMYLYNSMPYYYLPKTRAHQKKLTITSVPAHWVNLTNFKHKYIIEPVNYLFIVYSVNKQQSVSRLLHVFKKIHFRSSTKHHSSNYWVYIDGHVYKQLADEGKGLSFSNQRFSKQNDHFRVFGPHLIAIHGIKAYLFVASVSEEAGLVNQYAHMPLSQLKALNIKMLKKNKFFWHYENFAHSFVSFSHAQSNLAVALIQAGLPTYYVSAANTVHTAGETTEDYIGKVYISILK